AVRLIASADPPIDWAALLDRAHATQLVQPVRRTLAYLLDELGMTQVDAFFELAGDAAADPSPDIRLISGSWVTGVGTRDLFANHWQRYRNVRRAMRRSAGPADFARYLLAYYRWKWQIDSPWRVPLRGARKFLRYVGRS